MNSRREVELAEADLKLVAQVGVAKHKGRSGVDFAGFTLGGGVSNGVWRLNFPTVPKTLPAAQVF